MGKKSGTSQEQARKGHAAFCWATQDMELEVYCQRPWGRLGGNMGLGRHRTTHPRLDELEGNWGHYRW